MRKIIQLLGALAVALGITGCISEKDSNFDGDGDFITNDTTLSYNDFDCVEMSGAVDVNFKQGKGFAIHVEQNDDPKIRLYVEKRGKTLVVYTKEKFIKGSLAGTKRPVVHITAPELTKMDCSGAVHFFADNITSTSDLSMDVSGASKAELGIVACKKLNMDCSGASHLKMERANCEELDAEVSGACGLEGDIKTGEAELECSGSCNVQLVLEGTSLELENTGAGKCNIDFSGNSVVCNGDGASNTTLQVECNNVTASCSGASKVVVKGKAEKTQFNKSGAATIDSSGLRKK